MLNTCTVATGRKSRPFSTVPPDMTHETNATLMRTARLRAINPASLHMSTIFLKYLNSCQHLSLVSALMYSNCLCT